MTKVKLKRIFTIIFCVVNLLIFLMILVSHLMSGSIAGPVDDLMDWNLKNEDQIAIKESTYEEKSIRYIVRGNQESKVNLVLIHGAPGSWDAFKDYLLDDRLANKFRMIAVDRLGYGGSDSGNPASIQDQVKMIRAIVLKYPSEQLVLVGHSYGAPIAAAYEATYGDASAIVLLSPVVDPENEKIFWFSYPAYWKLTRWVFPDWIKVSTSEKFVHADELKKIVGIWSKIDKPIYHLHAENDWIAPGKENIEFLENAVPDSILHQDLRDGKGHFIPWNDYDFVVKTLFKALKGI